MPLVKIQTNIELASADQKKLLQQVSAFTAKQLGKPESYVMVAFEPCSQMLFAGSDDASCYVEFKSIGLADSQTTAISAALCELLAEEINIPPERVYIEFSSAERALWGWNSKTF